MEKEVKKFIDFIITQKCTYSCPYCSQSKSKLKEPKNANKKTINSFYNFLKTLDRNYEITITGGEAILHPDFFGIIKTIKELGFKLNLITNLSFNIETYKKIFDILKDNLNRFDISFHLEVIKDFDSTYKKAELFLQNKPQNTKVTFFIPLFLINQSKEEKIEKLISLANRYNIQYSFQKIRFLNSYKKENTPNSNKYTSSHSMINSYSKICHAGFNSAVIYEDGNVYRCYSSRFLKTNFLGNINNKFLKLNDKAQACPKNCCTCPKPSKYNQITNKKDKKSALKQKITNAIFLPLMLVKNRNIVLEKLKHYLDLSKS